MTRGSNLHFSSQNVLLDAALTPKVADFGLCDPTANQCGLYDHRHGSWSHDTFQ